MVAEKTKTSELNSQALFKRGYFLMGTCNTGFNLVRHFKEDEKDVCYPLVNKDFGNYFKIIDIDIDPINPIIEIWRYILLELEEQIEYYEDPDSEDIQKLDKEVHRVFTTEDERKNFWEYFYGVFLNELRDIVDFLK